MFTGLVEETGTISEIRDEGPDSKKFVLRAKTVLDDVEIGASIAINGCCLTVVEINSQQISFQAGSETLSRTNLGNLAIGDRVNLERAVRASDRLGGHIVSGHIDAIGKSRRARRFRRLVRLLVLGSKRVNSTNGVQGVDYGRWSKSHAR